MYHLEPRALGNRRHLVGAAEMDIIRGMVLDHLTAEIDVNRTHRRPAVALAALVAVLHLSVLAGRLGNRRLVPGACNVLAWRAPATGPGDETAAASQSPSNPQHTYSAGQLALDTGIAVIALAAWLRVMRLNGARGL